MLSARILYNMLVGAVLGYFGLYAINPVFYSLETLLATIYISALGGAVLVAFMPLYATPYAHRNLAPLLAAGAGFAAVWLIVEWWRFPEGEDWEYIPALEGPGWWALWGVSLAAGYAAMMLWFALNRRES